MKRDQLFAAILVLCLRLAYCRVGSAVASESLPSFTEVAEVMHSTMSRLAEIGAHADVSTRDPTKTKSKAKDHVEEAILTRNLSPVPKTKNLYLSNPRKFTFSEAHQDLMLEPLLAGVHQGFYVESGAFDGEVGSNTLYFERRRGWSGLLVEPSPINLPKLRAKNRNAYIFSGCLSDSYEQAWLGDLLVSNGDHSHLTSEHDSAANPVPVTCAPLPALLKLIGKTVVDLWSLNVEGSEVRVLKGMDFKSIEVGILLVASHKSHNVDATPEIASIMKAQGFKEAGRLNLGESKPVQIVYVNPKYFLKRHLLVPKAWGQPQGPASTSKLQPEKTMLLKQYAAPTPAKPLPATPVKASAANTTNTTNIGPADPGLSRWASVPLILIVAVLGVACCLKPEVK